MVHSALQNRGTVFEEKFRSAKGFRRVNFDPQQPGLRQNPETPTAFQLMCVADVSDSARLAVNSTSSCLVAIVRRQVVILHHPLLDESRRIFSSGVRGLHALHD
jgi:hypothetical protein